jgi:hypothetical protein
MKKIFLCFFVLGWIINNAAFAEKIRVAPRPLLDVQIHGDERGLLPLNYSRDSYQVDGHYSIEARMGERFRLVVTNNSGRRIGLVISIDGLNIITGNTCYHRQDESMYLLEPGQSGSFSGWRRDYDSVARFYFTDKSDSYATRIGKYGEHGWIKIAAFQERQPIVVVPKRYDDFSDKRMAESSQAGTGYGERQYSPVETADFNPESFPVQMLRIKYDFPVKKYQYPEFAPEP